VASEEDGSFNCKWVSSKGRGKVSLEVVELGFDA
jgi:hypothetical protein